MIDSHAIIEIDELSGLQKMTPGGICWLNNRITKHNEHPKNLSGIYASIHYYPTTQMRIASVVRALIKNHYFMDGNKRTALIVYTLLCEFNGVEKKQDLGEIFEDIAGNNYSVEQVHDMIFNQSRSCGVEQS